MNTKNLILVSALLWGCSADPSDPAQDAGPDPDAAIVIPECMAGTSSADLRINEFMAANAVTILDADGLADDWIEIYNASAADVDMCGWTISSKGLTQASFEMNGLIVPAGGHTLIWMIGDRGLTRVEQAALAISAKGGELSLLAPDGTQVDHVVYGAQAADFSATRLSDDADLWALAWHPTPGAANGDAGLDGAFAATEPGQVPSAEGLDELLMGYDAFPQVGIRIDAAGVDSLREAPRIFVPGYLTFKGREYGPVGIRLKGSNSFQPIDEKPSFRINIDEFVVAAKFFGLDDLTLNNMDNDFSMMHERLSYFIARQLGPASRSSHALVSFNDVDYGLYANVETVKHAMVGRWFEDDQGPLFEATDVDFRPEFVDGYEHESGPDDRALIGQLTLALQNPNPDQAMAEAAVVLDMDAFYQFWATCAVVAQFDSFPYSDPGDDYFVYVDPISNKLHFLPWGMDETFYSGSFDVLQVRSLLATTCLASPSCKQQVVDKIWATLALAESMDWAAERIRIRDEMLPFMMDDNKKPYTNAEVTEYHLQMGFFISGRRSNLGAMLPPPSQP